MNKEEALYRRANKGKRLIRLYVAFLFILTLASGAACSLRSESAPQETANAPGHNSQLAREAMPPQSPTSFEYVQLLDRRNWIVADFTHVWKTEDGGHIWSQVFSVDPKTGNGKYTGGLSFVDAKTGFLIIDRKVLRTDNGGKDWEEITKIDFGPQKCYFIDALHGWIVGAVWREEYLTDPKMPQYTGVAFATQDGGLTWQRLELPSTNLPDAKRWSFRDVFFNDARTGWIVGDVGMILRTEDGGRTWHLAKADKVDYQDVGFLDEQFGWATYKYGNSSWGVAVTTNGGRHWKLLDESFVYGTWPVFAVFLTPEHGFVANLKLYETRDSGRQWKWRKGSDNVREVVYEYLGRARDGTLVALGLNNGAVTTLISRDNGRVWHPS